MALRRVDNVMRVSPEGLRFIQRFEGFSAVPYLCPAGYWTIGYGHVLATREQLPSVTQAEADLLLQQDVRIAEQSVARMITVALSQNQFDALVSFTFNLGSGALQRSALRRVINRGDYADASQEFLKWVWADGKPLPGLIRRRRAEASVYINNIYNQ